MEAASLSAGVSTSADWATHVECYLQRSWNGICPVMERAGVETRIVAVAGDPLDELLRFADQSHTSLMVLGTRGPCLLSELLVGSESPDIVP
jgi:hypothetical protein